MLECKVRDEGEIIKNVCGSGRLTRTFPFELLEREDDLWIKVLYVWKEVRRRVGIEAGESIRYIMEGDSVVDELDKIVEKILSEI
jgi:hypothetical protein